MAPVKKEVKNLFSTDIPMLPSPAICICQSEEDMAAVEKAYDVELDRLGLDGQVSFVCNDVTGDKFLLIYVEPPEGLTYAQIAALCAHEAYHATCSYLENWLGEEEAGEEITAYILQSITQLIIDVLKFGGKVSK